MRELAGFAGFHLILAAAGMALLYALGLVRLAPRALLAAAGPAVLCGIALVMQVEIALAVLGAPVSLATFVAVGAGSSVLLALVPAVLRRRGHPVAPVEEERLPRDRLDVWSVRVAAVALAVFFLVGARAFVHVPTVEDDAHIWSIKALALFFFDGLDSEVFTGSGYALAHPDYPILQPLLEATLYRARGGDDLRLAHLELWIVAAAFVWTAAYLLFPRRHPLVWLAPLAALAVAPGVLRQVQLGYADVTVSCFGATGALSLGLWVERRRTGHLLLAALLLGAAANTKDEGLAMLAAATVAAAATIAWERRRPPLAPLLGAGAVALAAVLPWRLWTLDRGDVHAPSTVSVSGPSEPVRDNGTLDRLLTALDGVVTQLVDQGRWLWILPAAIAVAGAALLARRGLRLAAYYVATGALTALAVVVAYWRGDNDLPAELGGGVERTVTGTVFVAAVAGAHLLSLWAARQGADGAEADPD